MNKKNRHTDYYNSKIHFIKKTQFFPSIRFPIPTQL